MAGSEGSDSPEAQNKRMPSRRYLLAGGTLAAALASAGIYELVDALIGTPERPTPPTPSTPPARPALPPEQYVFPRPRVIMDDGTGVASSKGTMAVAIPPYHAHVITAKLNVPANAKSLQAAQRRLEEVLRRLEQQFPPAPSGVTVTVSWGLPYFEHYVPRLGKGSSYFDAGTAYPAYLPVDLTTSKERGKTVYALQESRTFPSDEPPPGFGPIRLEQNDMAVLLRGDSLTTLMAATNALFGTGDDQAGDLFKVTSIRRGFTGGGHTGGQTLASKLAIEHDLPGAKLIPRQSPIFLGFTTTLRDAESSTPSPTSRRFPAGPTSGPTAISSRGPSCPCRTSSRTSWPGTPRRSRNSRTASTPCSARESPSRRTRSRRTRPSRTRPTSFTT
ncbi:hypothetical protein ACFQYP_02385 [Nonomuraea antimicrobica]